MKIEKFQLRGNSSSCAGRIHVLRDRAPALLGGNIDTIHITDNMFWIKICVCALPFVPSLW
jgi:hypothetical protein